MDAQVQLATRVIARNVPILLHGETGTGKDVFANALHTASPAAQGAFVAINCASLPESLIESELFGYRAGAFTRVLEERRVTPLGSETSARVDFQLISASHRNLAELVHDGRFREDLFYRLSGVELRLPPLRERADRLALIHAILAEEAGPQETPPTLAPDAEQALMRYDWPGNLRQLRYVLRTAVALCDGTRLTSRQLPPEVVQGAQHAARRGRGADAGANASQPAQESLPPFNAIQLNERKTILDLLETHRWNVSTVARTLRVSRNTLYRKMHQLCIEIAREAAASRHEAGA
jgi:transcriptional regulator of acetoin/glycerol metabolism